jgi:hypothetical protein
MKIMCLDNKIEWANNKELKLTIGKIYDAKEYVIGFSVINDLGERETFQKDRFIKIRHLRHQNLLKLEI